MAAGEDQAQAVVANRLLQDLVSGRIGNLLDDIGMVVKAGEARVSANPVDGLEAADRDKPGDRVGRHTVTRPLLCGGGKGVMFGVLGQLKAPEQPDEGRENASPVTAVDRLERGDPFGVQHSLPHARASSCSARASGVRASPKSSMPNSGRISISDSLIIGFGQRRTHSMASSSEPTFQIQ